MCALYFQFCCLIQCTKSFTEKLAALAVVCQCIGSSTSDFIAYCVLQTFSGAAATLAAFGASFSFGSYDPVGFLLGEIEPSIIDAPAEPATALSPIGALDVEEVGPL